MTLKGIKVIELMGLAPGPFCGMILADFGAAVTVVDKIQPQMFNVLGNGKKNVALNLKDVRGRKVFRELCKESDVLIEPFRPGVMEKMGLGPDILLADNPKLIYARLTGYGQGGELYKKAGHDINYVSITGVLSLLGRKDSNPFPPINIAADFAGGGLMCAFGIVMALFERTKSNKGQVLDSSMVDGTAYISSWIYRSQKLPVWGGEKEENILDGGAHFYDTYRTKDGKFMAVGAIEPQFYQDLLAGLEMDPTEQFDDFQKKKELFKTAFLKRTQQEWCEIFDKRDACVTPVLSLDEAIKYKHNTDRSTFIKSFENEMVPNPAPRLSRTPASSVAVQRPAHHGENTREMLAGLKYSESEIQDLHKNGVIYAYNKSHL